MTKDEIARDLKYRRTQHSWSYFQVCEEPVTQCIAFTLNLLIWGICKRILLTLSILLTLQSFWGIFGSSTFRGIFGDIFLGIRDVKGQAAVQSVSLLTGAVHLSTLQLRIENSPTEVTSLRSRLFRQVWNEARTRKVRTKIEAWQLVNLPTISA